MLALPYLLSTTYKRPKLLQQVKQINIYIDESISFSDDNETRAPQKFVTAFYATCCASINKLFTEYDKTIYSSNSQKKSTNVPDAVNTLALTVAQKYLEETFILERKAYDYDSFGNYKKDIFLALELESYISPIKKILESIKDKYSVDKFLINVIIDQTSQNCIEPCLSYNQYLLNQIAKQLEDNQTSFEIHYQTADSKANYGIQIADMLAGAYRKEQAYKNSATPLSLIPFDYRIEKMNDRLVENENFTKMFGTICFQKISHDPDYLPTTIPNLSLDTKTTPSWKTTFNYHLNHLFRQIFLPFKRNFTHYLKRTIYLLEELQTMHGNQKLREKAVPLILMLDQNLKPISNSIDFKKTTYIRSFSEKTDSKHFKNTINNLIRNLQAINKCLDSHTIKKEIATLLKRFDCNVMDVISNC